MLNFLENASNQFLPSKSFYNNYYKLVDFLSKARLMPNIVVFSEYNSNKPVENELEEINKIIDLLIQEIDTEQIKLYEKIWKNR
mgnify:CR=1 FL=1